MLSFGKLMLLLGVVIAVFVVYGWMRRNRVAQDTTQRQRLPGDMVRCSVCGAFADPDAGDCGKPGCPMGRRD